MSDYETGTEIGDAYERGRARGEKEALEVVRQIVRGEHSADCDCAGCITFRSLGWTVERMEIIEDNKVLAEIPRAFLMMDDDYNQESED